MENVQEGAGPTGAEGVMRSWKVEEVLPGGAPPIPNAGSAPALYRMRCAPRASRPPPADLQITKPMPGRGRTSARRSGPASIRWEGADPFPAPDDGWGG